MATLSERIEAKRVSRTQAIKKAAVCAAVLAFGFAAMGYYDGDQEMVETTYIVRQGDTLRDISEEYLEKNTGGRRYILEFESGIRELNPWLAEDGAVIHPGDELRINYWIKKGGDGDGED